ncbi:TniQ family protein [uncultured Pseudonocardia sp.]|uniref:TniQ family protein n=1 Tax=uncultured Pseudonocardia sp. TaxID=211455 RepID=UPI002620A113|nr:TniQ family protein [uncultured Pseudonocardia sp.]
MTAPRRLPIRLEPVAGEGLDSWLEAHARRLTTPPRDLLTALGLTTPHQRGLPPAFIVCLHKQERAGLAAATSVEPDVLEAMTLARFHPVAVHIDRPSRQVARGYLWGRGSGSRFCPHCLADNGGRWLLGWRLGWSFACLRHRCLLADCCPGCGRVPRRGQLWLDVPRAARCSEHPGPQRVGRALVRCHHDLTTTPVLALPAEHPALHAQHLIDAAIGQRSAGFGVYTDAPVPAANMLADLRILAGRVLKYLPPDELDDVVPTDLLHAYRAARAAPGGYLTPARLDPKRAGDTAPSRAAVTALAVTLALRVLTAADLDSAVGVLRGLAPPGDPARAMLARYVTTGAAVAPTEPFTTIMNRARYVLLRPGPSRVRHVHDILGGPITCAGRDRSGQVPLVFWPWWTLRLAPDRTDSRRVRGPLGCLVVAAGTSLSTARSAAVLGPAVSRFYTMAVLRRLNEQSRWPDIHTALDRVAEYLDRHGTPIDYQHRRALDYTRLLPEPEWLELCARAGLPRRRGWHRPARCVLFETLSGLPADLAPTHFAPTTPAQWTAVADFPGRLTPQLARLLAATAADFLAARGIDEPVTWQPPFTLADDLELPGIDPDSVDVRPLHQLLVGGETVGRAATRLEMPLPVARYLLARHPAEHDQGALAVLRHRLPANVFHGLYVDLGWSLSAVADLYDTNRYRIKQLAAVYDITMRHPTAPPPGSPGYPTPGSSHDRDAARCPGCAMTSSCGWAGRSSSRPASCGYC